MNPKSPIWPSMVEHALSYFKSPVSYSFTENERIALGPFFTNLDKRVYFIQVLPPALIATLMAMYSRLKNTRGLRGHFVDSFLPVALLSKDQQFNEKSLKDVEVYIRVNKIDSLDAFINHSESTALIWNEFKREVALVNTKALSALGGSVKVSEFMSIFLHEKYGHNSIARMGTVWFCCEDVSLLTAKSLEWSRPASGFIELSTRFVSMSNKSLYPIDEELSLIDKRLGSRTKEIIDEHFSAYCELVDARGGDSFHEFLLQTYANKVPDPKKLEAGAFGELCDVAGNLLPGATLTSLGVSVSGEGFPTLLKHLLIDQTPENYALAYILMEESKQVNADQFIRHFSMDFDVDSQFSEYLSVENFYVEKFSVALPSSHFILSYFQVLGINLEELIKKMKDRSRFEKLPSAFEGLTAVFSGVMSFRGWRDLQRHTFSTHMRTLLTPHLGFYEYDKPHPESLKKIFHICETNARLSYEEKIREFPGIEFLLQYELPLGFLVGYTFSANFRQIEFCTMQRTKPSVNHEVRGELLRIEQYMRKTYPELWKALSRADMTPAYIFARGSEIPLTL